MRKRLLTLVLALTAVLQTVWAYDFSATSPSGHTLYYEIISGTTNVGVVRPETGSTYDNYVTGNVVIPATVTYGGTTYNVTELRSINNYYGSFEGCSGLTSVTIPNSVTTIGNSAFSNCSGLTTLNFNAINCNDFTSYSRFNSCPITTINIGDSVQRIPAYFASGLNSLTSVIIGNSVTTIGESAFFNCSGLTSVTIPNSVTTIENSAFSNCSGLTSVTIPNSVTTIGISAFYGCSGLTTLNFNAVNCSDPLSQLFYLCPISTINIGDGVQRIPTYFAYNLDSLTSVTIPNSVTSIGDNAFSYCRNVNSVSFGNGLVSIGNYNFTECKVTSVVIPNSVTTIGRNLFYDCDSLTHLIIGNSVTHIEDGSFYLCSNLHEVICMAEYPPTLDGRDFFSSIATLKVPCNKSDDYNESSISSWWLYFIDIEEMCGDIGNNDTTITTNDTVYITIYDTITNIVHDTIAIHDTVFTTVYDTMFVTDTLWMFDTIYIYDTIYIRDSTTGIEDVAVINARVYSSHSRIVVEGAEGNNVMLFDMQGRLLSTKRDEYSVLEFEVPISGAYFVKIGNYKAKKVVVIK